MSLQVWLPLTRDLRNQGLSDVTVTNNGATFNSNGKLGGCYNFTSQNIVIPSTNFKSEFTNNQASLAAWVKVATSHNTYAQALVLGTQGTSWNNILFGIDINSSGTPIANTSTGSAYTNLSFGTVIKDGVWHHIVYTYNAGTMTVYLDGVQKATKTTSNTPAWTSSTNLYIGGNTAGEKFQNGDGMNDVRVYNHCLSPKEVKELSKGLVLHYSLNRQGWGQENLILNSNTFAVGSGATGVTPSTTAEGYHQVIAASSNSNWHSSWATATSTSLLENTFAEGDPFTISFTIKSENANKTTPPTIYVKSGMGYYAMKGKVTSNWSTVYYSGTWKDTNAIAFHLGFAGLVGTYLFKNWKVEKGSIPTPWCPNSSDTLADTMGLNSNIEYDTSGFNNNGTKIGTLTYTSDTPKYEVSTHIGSTSSKIHISNFPTSGFGNTYSFAWWGKRSSNSPMFWGFSDGIRLNGMYIGTLWNTGDGSNNPLYKIGTTTQVIAPSTGIWHHYVMTGDGTKCYVYLDGELWAEAKTYKAISGTSIYINGWDSNTQYCSDNTDISDFRIYATALSASDVKSLYQNCATIGADGKIYGQIRA